MNGLMRALVPAWLVLACVVVAWADEPIWDPPHGMIAVEVQKSNQQLVAVNGAAGFAPLPDGTVFFTRNAADNFILFNTAGGKLGDDDLLGGIANRTRPSQPGPFPAATATSTSLLTDDPGFTTSIGTADPELESFPIGYLMKIHFRNSLLFYDGAAWTEPVSGERLQALDINGTDDLAEELKDFGVQEADLEATYTGTSSGDLGAMNLAFRSGRFTPVHSHVVYELTREDGGIPAAGAYMIEVGLSAEDVADTGGQTLLDSDPIFILFNNQLDTVDPDGGGPLPSEFQRAIAAAEQLPEPSTLAMVVVGGASLIGRRRLLC